MLTVAPGLPLRGVALSPGKHTITMDLKISMQVWNISLTINQNQVTNDQQASKQ